VGAVQAACTAAEGVHHTQAMKYLGEDEKGNSKRQLSHKTVKEKMKPDGFNMTILFNGEVALWNSSVF